MTTLIVIPTYNCKEHIVRTIESVLSQTAINTISCLIVDDCSNDGTYDILQSYKSNNPCITLLRNPKNIGAAKNVQLCEIFARQYSKQFEFILKLGYKDYISPGFVEGSSTFLYTNPEYIAVSGKQYRADLNDVNSTISEIPKYPFYNAQGIENFVDSAISLVDCTIYSCIFRTELYAHAPWWPCDSKIWGMDHIFISTLSYFGKIKILESEIYIRDEPQSRHGPADNQINSGETRGSMIANLIQLYMNVFDTLSHRESNSVRAFNPELKSKLHRGLLQRFSPLIF